MECEGECRWERSQSEKDEGLHGSDRICWMRWRVGEKSNEVVKKEKPRNGRI